MDQPFDDIEDFMTDESFRSWALRPTPELDKQWATWLENNPDKAHLLDKAVELTQSLTFTRYQADSGVKQRILERIHLETLPRKTKQVSLFGGNWYRIAAACVLAIGLGVWAYQALDRRDAGRPQAEAVEMVRKQNPIGVKSQHTLSDGSKVFLNSGSSLEYPKAFGADSREVKLTGEAYFQVATDAQRPFKVLAEGFEVTVLGTQFNVDADPQGPTVALVEGKVRLSAATGASLELKPGQMAVSDPAGAFTPVPFDPDDVVVWKDGVLVFRDAPLDEVIEKLRRWYGVEISVRNKPKSSDWSYTGRFKNERLENVLLNMSTLRGFGYEIKNDSLIISF